MVNQKHERQAKSIDTLIKAAIMAGSEVTNAWNCPGNTLEFYRQLVDEGVPELPAAIMAGSAVTKAWNSPYKTLEFYRELEKVKDLRGVDKV